MMDIKTLLKQGDAAQRLIYVNLGVFVIVTAIEVLARLFLLRPPFSTLSTLLALPATWTDVMHRPWTLLSYMFMHDGFWHLFFNMLCLYWFGKIVLADIGGRRLTGLYLFGGLTGALFYLLAFNLLPAYQMVADASLLVGASGCIMAIIVAAAMYKPDMPLRLLFIGSVRLKWIAIGAIAVSLLGITGSNAGGQLAHVGGAVGGWLFVWLLRHNVDLTQPIRRLREKRRVRHHDNSRTDNTRKFHYQRATHTNNTQRTTDADYNSQRAKHNARIDAILDKIKASGYDSLTEEEKRELFQ